MHDHEHFRPNPDELRRVRADNAHRARQDFLKQLESRYQTYQRLLTVAKLEQASDEIKAAVFAFTSLPRIEKWKPTQLDAHLLIRIGLGLFAIEHAQRAGAKVDASPLTNYLANQFISGGDRVHVEESKVSELLGLALLCADFFGPTGANILPVSKEEQVKMPDMLVGMSADKTIPFSLPIVLECEVTRGQPPEGLAQLNQLKVDLLKRMEDKSWANTHQIVLIVDEKILSPNHKASAQNDLITVINELFNLPHPPNQVWSKSTSTFSVYLVNRNYAQQNVASFTAPREWVGRLTEPWRAEVAKQGVPYQEGAVVVHIGYKLGRDFRALKQKLDRLQQFDKESPYVIIFDMSHLVLAPQDLEDGAQRLFGQSPAVSGIMAFKLVLANDLQSFYWRVAFIRNQQAAALKQNLPSALLELEQQGLSSVDLPRLEALQIHLEPPYAELLKTNLSTDQLAELKNQIDQIWSKPS